VIADRQVGGYLKNPEMDYETSPPTLLRPANKSILYQAIKDPGSMIITDDDIEQGRELHSFISQNLTMAMLRGQFNDFQRVQAEVVAREVFGANSMYHVSILASLPEQPRRYHQRQHYEELVRNSTALPDLVGSRVTVYGLVVRNIWSEKWNTHYVTVITDSNAQVFFAYKKPLLVGERGSFTGTVKRQDTQSTQLNRVVANLEESVCKLSSESF
jgi:hypothetical protein